MRFEIAYRLRFEYENVVRHAHNELRACPVSDPHQSLLAYRTVIHPAARVQSHTDYWGTRVDAYGIREPHVAVEVLAEASVETQPRALAVASPALDLLEDPAFREPLIEFLAPTRHTEPGPRVDALAADVRAGASADVVSTVLDLQRRVHRRLSYEPGTTHIGITPDEVLDGGVGVCQDYAHVAVAVCRRLGIPARYVSGYFFATDDRTGAAAADEATVQTHAWFEAAIPGVGWLALDPTNALEVGERHVVIGRGREYDDVLPFRGVFSGSSTLAMSAEVVMRRLSTPVVASAPGELGAWPAPHAPFVAVPTTAAVWDRAASQVPQ